MARIAYYSPAYRSTIAVQTRINFGAACHWAQDNGHVLLDLYTDFSGIARSRNYALRVARSYGCEFILMQDADVYTEPPVNPLALLHTTARLCDATVTGGVVALRNREKLNVDPLKPGEVYNANRLGTALMLIDLVRLDRLEAGPSVQWFKDSFSADGSTLDMGEDVYFTERVNKLGGKVVADYTFRTLHQCTIEVDNAHERGSDTSCEGGTSYGHSEAG